MKNAARLLVGLLVVGSVLLLVGNSAAQSSATAEEIQLAVTARIDEHERVEFGIIPPTGGTARRLLPRARFLALDRVQTASPWSNSSPITVRLPSLAGDSMAVRVTARATGTNTVEFGLQQRDASGDWGERILPPRRFFPLTTVAGAWLRSRLVTVDASHVGLSDCTVDQQIAIGRGCRYPGATDVFSVDLQGRGTYQAESSADQLVVRFNVGTSFHELHAEAERSAWRITKLGALPFCGRDQLVGPGETCDHPDTGDEFRVGDDRSAAFRGRSYGSAGIQLDDFEAARSNHAAGWTTTRVSHPPEIEEIHCSPDQPMVDEVVRCTAVSNTALDAYSWSTTSGSRQRSSGADFETTFSNARNVTIRLSATAVTGGSGAASTSLRVYESPAIDELACLPADPGVGDRLACQADFSGLVTGLTWRVNDVRVRSRSTQLITSLDEPGDYRITVAADSGRGRSDQRTVIVTANVRAVDITAGYGHTCALDVTGHIECWGYNSHGQADPPDGQFKQISAGYQHTCAIDFRDNAVCWGSNTRFDGEYSGHSDPPVGQFVQIDGGTQNTCGVLIDGQIECWGVYNSGATPIVTGRPFDHVSVGGSRICAIMIGGQLHCVNQWNKVHNPPPSGTFKRVSISQDTACAIHTDDLLVCWNQYKAQYNPTYPEHGRYADLSVAAWHTCAISETDLNFDIVCWRHDPLEWVHHFGQTLSPRGEFTKVASGTFHTCGIKEEGFVVCFGSNSSGQLEVPEYFADPDPR